MNVEFHVTEKLEWANKAGNKSKYLPGLVYRVTPENKDWVSEQMRAGKARFGRSPEETRQEGSRRLAAGGASLKGTLTVHDDKKEG